MLIDDYVADLSRTLRGPHGPKRDMVVEARHSLLDAAEAYQAGGLDRTEAERRAVAEFGAVGEIAPGFQEELVICAGRRLAWLMFLSTPLICLLWSLIWRAFPYDVNDWANRPEWFVPVARALDILQILSGALGAAALVALRRRSRALPVTRGLAWYCWAFLVCSGLLSLALTAGADGPQGFSDYLPGTLLALTSWLFTLAQIYVAAQCQRLTRRLWA
ncbi:permease prefix domain 1-containing protein [Thermoactinospora rubra]|uniref:permease prefix domain 1-containing protein n=1 Tax=Thermoactinospora rubra TaxID=1088767 RepID=UPI000A101D2A|nr:permease prefix domain 1-containing protein [Thermoactinospora rubra]